jgi:secondary thiamine-phosphate synthase enzyme
MTGDCDGAAGMLRQQRSTFRYRTNGPGFRDIGPQIFSWLHEIEARDGLLTIFIRHTSASLTIQENADPDVLRDLIDSLAGAAPRDHAYRHSTEGPDDMPAHIKSMLTSTSLSVPIADGQMMLGTWQAIYLIEHRDKPHDREIVLHYVGELDR